MKSVTEKKDTPSTLENTPPLLDRNLYKTIKKMDRASLESLINDIYESGRKKGIEVSSDNSVPKQESHTDDSTDNHHTLDLRVLEKEIRSVKGIGKKRTEEIMLLIEKWLKLE